MKKQSKLKSSAHFFQHDGNEKVGKRKDGAHERWKHKANSKAVANFQHGGNTKDALVPLSFMEVINCELKIKTHFHKGEFIRYSDRSTKVARNQTRPPPTFLCAPIVAPSGRQS